MTAARNSSLLDLTLSYPLKTAPMSIEPKVAGAGAGGLGAAAACGCDAALRTPASGCCPSEGPTSRPRPTTPRPAATTARDETIIVQLLCPAAAAARDRRESPSPTRPGTGWPPRRSLDEAHGTPGAGPGGGPRTGPGPRADPGASVVARHSASNRRRGQAEPPRRRGRFPLPNRASPRPPRGSRKRKENSVQVLRREGSGTDRHRARARMGGTRRRSARSTIQVGKCSTPEGAVGGVADRFNRAARFGRRKWGSSPQGACAKWGGRRSRAGACPRPGKSPRRRSDIILPNT